MPRHPRTASTLAGATLLALAGPLAAQVVSPQHFTVTESPGASSTPFGEFGAIMTPFRYLQVHDDVPAMVVHGFACRHDSVSTGAIQAPFTLTLDAWMSTAPVGIAAPTVSATFDSNHGPNRIQVVTNRTIAVPGNDPSSVPGPFALDIPFDNGVQFTYAAGGLALVWEVRITARTNIASLAFDAVSTLNSQPTNPQHGSSKAFTGCLATGNTNPITVTPSGGMSWPGGGGQVAIAAHNLQPNSIAIWVFGLDTAQWAGLPLPIDVPGSASAPSGTCTLRTGLLDLRVTSVGAAGGGTFGLPVPANPLLHSATIYMQVVGIDPTANPFGFTVSNLAMQQLCAPYPTPLPVGNVQLAGNLGPMGFVTSTSLVTRFY